MSKTETVRSLPPPAGAPSAALVQSVAQIQRESSNLSRQMQHLGQTLAGWVRRSEEASEQQQRQVLDLAVLVESIAPALESIQSKQREQDARLANIEAALQRVMTALPSPVKVDDRRVQPRLASRDDLAALPARVWEVKPKIFGKP